MTTLISRFNRETYKAFHLSKKPPQMVANLNAPDPDKATVNIDVRRCRFNGFVQQVHNLPVFAPTHEILPATLGTLRDYNWVDKAFTDPVATLPY